MRTIVLTSADLNKTKAEIIAALAPTHETRRYCANGCGYKLPAEYAPEETVCGACLDEPQLIAAAPELLEALNEIADILTAIKCSSSFPQIPEAQQQRVDEALTEARAAIAKAKGETK